jgi:lysophospholipase L1-like esterase
MRRILLACLAAVVMGSALCGCSLQKNQPSLETGQETSPDGAGTEASQTGNSQVKLERNDWSTIWIENANQSDLPRILFVGDSITEGYYNDLKESLGEIYYLGRYTTSKFVGNPDYIAELSILLNRYQFKIILLNNGLHGWDYSLEAYRSGLHDLLVLLHEAAPGAALIWCQTTPVRLEEDLSMLDPLNLQVTAKNQAALEIMENEDIPVIDLYSEMLDHPEYYRSDGLHFNDQGKSAQADVIVEFIRNMH